VTSNENSSTTWKLLVGNIYWHATYAMCCTCERGLNMGMKKKDCFGYEPRKCIALKNQQCDKCVFYKSITQHAEDIVESLRKINSLDKEKRDYIIASYYTNNR